MCVPTSSMSIILHLGQFSRMFAVAFNQPSLYLEPVNFPDVLVGERQRADETSTKAASTHPSC